MTSPEQQMVMDLLCLPENQLCADCQKQKPMWASANLGVFICIDCSGIHRNLGTHISFVRSCELDEWKREQAIKMKYLGNEVMNKYYEAKLPKNFIRPDPRDRPNMEAFIHAKYVEHRWADNSRTPPNKLPNSKLKCRTQEEIDYYTHLPQVEEKEPEVDIDDILAQIDENPTPIRKAVNEPPPPVLQQIPPQVTAPPPPEPKRTESAFSFGKISSFLGSAINKVQSVFSHETKSSPEIPKPAQPVNHPTIVSSNASPFGDRSELKSFFSDDEDVIPTEKTHPNKKTEDVDGFGDQAALKSFFGDDSSDSDEDLQHAENTDSAKTPNDSNINEKQDIELFHREDQLITKQSNSPKTVSSAFGDEDDLEAFLDS